MADKNFKVKSGLNIPITSAAILTTDSSGNISSTAVLPITAGGTGQTSATNAINALLPVQNGSTVNYVIQSDGTNINWGKLYNQTIKNNGTTVTPRGNINVIGATFADDSGTDTTTITFTDTTGVSTSGGSTITTSSASVVGLIVKGSASQTANLQEWQNSSGTVLAKVASDGLLKVFNGTNLSRTFFLPDGATDATTHSYAYFNTASGGQGIYAKNLVPTVVPLTIMGYASQTANLQEWQNSAGTTMAWIDAYGHVKTDGYVQVGLNNGFAVGGAFIIRTNYSSNNSINIGNGVSQQTAAQVQVTNSAAGIVGLIVKGAASQTANLQQWQDSTGAVKAFIRSDGFLRADSNLQTPTIYGPSGTGGTQANIATAWTFTTNVATNVGIIIKGAASQTANLQEWQNSAGSVLSKVTSDGSIQTPGISVQYGLYSTTVGKASINPNYDTGAMGVYSENAANKALVVRGAASQTANLQEWQDSSGTVGFRVNASPQTIGFNAATTARIQVGSVDTMTYNASTGWAFTPYDSSKIGLTVKGAASQTAALQQWQNSSGGVLSEIRNSGQFRSGVGAIFGSVSGYSAGLVSLFNNSASQVPLFIQASPSQTADLQQWVSSSSTVLAKVDASGSMFTTTAAAGTNTTQVATTAFVKTAIDNLVDSAPGTLDTLNEIAAALNDDPNFYTTITTLTSALENNDVYNYMGVF